MPEIVEKNPRVLGGQPVIKGTRIPVSRILALIGMDYKLKDIQKEFPRLANISKKQFSEMLNYYLKSSISYR